MWEEGRELTGRHCLQSSPADPVHGSARALRLGLSVTSPLAVAALYADGLASERQGKAVMSDRCLHMMLLHHRGVGVLGERHRSGVSCEEVIRHRVASQIGKSHAVWTRG